MKAPLLQHSVEQCRKCTGCYPRKVLDDKIYCNRENRLRLKERGIRLAAKPLGRPPAQVVNHHVRPSERNPIEGKFGQGKVKYGLNVIRAPLQYTSESWIACIALVLNLAQWAAKALLCLFVQLLQTFSTTILDANKDMKTVQLVSRLV